MPPSLYLCTHLKTRPVHCKCRCDLIFGPVLRASHVYGKHPDADPAVPLAACSAGRYDGRIHVGQA